MWVTIRARLKDRLRAEKADRAPRRRNLNPFEAAAAYVVASAENDQERMDDAATRIDPEALEFGINELARRAVVALAADRRTSPEAVARALLGLPPTAA